MPEPRRRRVGARRALLLFACLLFAPAALAERWYQVELVVFAQPGGAGAERWEALPTLAYPGASRFLLDPQRINAALAAQPGAARLDPFGRLFITPPAPFDAAAPDAPAPDVTLPEATAPDTAALEQPPATAASDAPALPTPFLLLPAGEQAFRGKAAYMERAGGYRILFHETWLQPVTGLRDALPIVIDTSGDSGDWPVLQGSVQLYVSRYLHVITNLWLNTDGAYLPGSWRMPEPPLGPPSVIVEEIVDETLGSITQEASVDLFDSDGPSTDPETESIEPVVDAGSDIATALEDDTAEGDAMEEPGAAAPASPWRHAVLLNQTRRMRSNEVHYIDHPMLGVIVQLTPLEEEDLLLHAEQERTRAPLPAELSAERLAAE